MLSVWNDTSLVDEAPPRMIFSFNRLDRRLPDKYASAFLLPTGTFKSSNEFTKTSSVKKTAQPACPERVGRRCI
jgi:hypothetical protein